ncbi:MAG: hypothetical protein D6788_11690 [Planctomycetota bacterium]|nr:MAG: hypothetical protein D6788_11690 [Planctomycetota bacterium]
MIPRLTGAGLGLLAFGISTIAGLLAGNPEDVILSRSILALFLFCVIGAVAGAAPPGATAQHRRRSEEAIRQRYAQSSSGGGVSESSAASSPPSEA